MVFKGKGLGRLISQVLLALGVRYSLTRFLIESKYVFAATADAASDSHYAGCIKILLCRHPARVWPSLERIFSERA